jgi:hypothetical protein
MPPHQHQPRRAKGSQKQSGPNTCCCWQGTCGSGAAGISWLMAHVAVEQWRRCEILLTSSSCWLAKATYTYSFFVRLDGHRSSCKGARQLVGHMGGIFQRLFDRNFYFMAHRHARCAKCACAADSTSEMQVRPTPATAPQMVPHRYRGRRTYRTTRSRRCFSRFQLQSTKMLQTAPVYLRT